MQPHLMVFLFLPDLVRSLTCAEACRACYTPETSMDRREVVCSMCLECNGGRRSRRKACSEFRECIRRFGEEGPECPTPPYCPPATEAEAATCATTTCRQPLELPCPVTTCRPVTTSIATIWEWFSRCRTIIVTTTPPPTTTHPPTRSTRAATISTVQDAPPEPACPPGPACPPVCPPCPQYTPGPQIPGPPAQSGEGLQDSQSIEIVLGISRKPKHDLF